MTQTQQLLEMFKENNNSITLGQILNSYLAVAYRQRISDLRQELLPKGYAINCYPDHIKKSLTMWKIEPIKQTLIIDTDGQTLIGECYQ